MPTELPKQFDPQAAQAKWLKVWNERGCFNADTPPADAGGSPKVPYTIVIPPPNVTGALHLGHGINDSLQDFLIRWRRMQGYNTLWVPGTDHAGIATQAVVERLILQQEGKTRHDLGRAELNRRIWQWKEQYEARILNQLAQLGFSCDWRRTRFTMDDLCTRAVRKTFFDMFKAGLIFRGKRLVNWDAHLQTSVADDETYSEDTKGGFWTFKYQVLGTNDFIQFSTTRPETMLGDVALCVHPKDPRYQHLIGKQARQPLVNRDIPIIADGQLADPELGTGCVKVTPAHDPNDYACWQRHPEIGMINILNPDGTLNEQAGRFAGMDRLKAREAVTKAMEELGQLVAYEDRVIPLKYSDRSKTPIEPYLSDQWFVKMGDNADGTPGLAQKAMDAVTSGQVKFFPERYAKTYLDWLGEKRDWCISRQLWWGHQIPIWYFQGDEAELKKTFGSRPDVSWRKDESGTWLISALTDLPELRSEASGLKTVQDPDVLDTWFSSALWPHATLGWPGPALPGQPASAANPEWEKERYFYPTSTLVTSRDIITLWVARMVIMSQFNLGTIPFSEVYIHPKILDGFGETMSKSKGNGVDPLDIASVYGADALRFGLAQLATETQDARLPVANLCPNCGVLVPVKHEHMYMKTKKLACPTCKKPFRPGGPWPLPDPELPTAKQSSERFELGRNFSTKLWNAARFILMNLEGYTPGSVEARTLPVEDRWLLSRLTQVCHQVTTAFEGYHFAEAARLLYDFTWSEFCDWYLEMSKSRLKEPAERLLAQRVLAGALDVILRLLHPIMPFVTESIWEALNEAAPRRGLPTPATASDLIMIAPWPVLPKELIDPATEGRIGRLQELIRGIRNARNEFRVDEKTTVKVAVQCAEPIAAELKVMAPFLASLAKADLTAADPGVAKPQQSATITHADFNCFVDLTGLIDIAAEVKRLEKQLADKEKQLAGLQGKLTNAGFLAKAQPEVVAETKQQVADLEKQLETIRATLKSWQA